MSPTNQAIQDAIDAGWDDTNYAFSSEDKKGSYIVGPWEYDDKVFLDPLFWRCLGKSRGWCDGSCQQGNAPLGYNAEDEIEWGACDKCVVLEREPKYIPNDWIHHWHRFIDTLAEGKSTDDFFSTLI